MIPADMAKPTLKQGEMENGYVVCDPNNERSGRTSDTDDQKDCSF